MPVIEKAPPNIEVPAAEVVLIAGYCDGVRRIEVYTTWSNDLSAIDLSWEGLQALPLRRLMTEHGIHELIFVKEPVDELFLATGLTRDQRAQVERDKADDDRRERECQLVSEQRRRDAAAERKREVDRDIRKLVERQRSLVSALLWEGDAAVFFSEQYLELEQLASGAERIPPDVAVQLRDLKDARTRCIAFDDAFQAALRTPLAVWPAWLRRAASDATADEDWTHGGHEVGHEALERHARRIFVTIGADGFPEASPQSAPPAVDRASVSPGPRPRARSSQSGSQYADPLSASGF